MPERTIVSYLVTEFYSYNCERSSPPPQRWELEPVYAESSPCDRLYFSKGWVIGQISRNISEKLVGLDYYTVFMLNPDGEAESGLFHLWKAFSVIEKAEEWVSSRMNLDADGWRNTKEKL